jgi:hypothetical protein
MDDKLSVAVRRIAEIAELNPVELKSGKLEPGKIPLATRTATEIDRTPLSSR